ncbi:VC1465 family Xer recombination activation factor [Polaromonas sp.]|uniref:VC1465 family Xer recombination activation factor n=1 Tax=Polaromonas sp. TaxID=1869339 RepID=UPI003457895A
MADQGLKHPEAAQFLHVSLRTLQNWLSGRHEVPYSVLKLLRLLRYMELPGDSWAGWHFSRGQLVTPEGRTISGKDGSWWSLLVRQAQGFGQLYREAQTACMDASYAVSLNQVPGQEARAARDDAVAPGPAPELATPPSNTGVNDGKWCESGATMAPWPQISDSLLPSIPSPAPTASGSELASIPSSVSPWTPISEGLRPPQTPLLPSSLWPLHHSRKSLQGSKWPSYAVSLQGPFQLPSPSTPAPRLDPSSFTTTASSLRRGRPLTPAPDPLRGAA